MEEDILSDVVPSNIVSRQVSRSREASALQFLMTLVQPSTGVDGESEYADELVSERDELMSDDDDDAEAKVCSRLPFFFVHRDDRMSQGCCWSIAIQTSQNATVCGTKAAETETQGG